MTDDTKRKAPPHVQGLRRAGNVAAKHRDLIVAVLLQHEGTIEVAGELISALDFVPPSKRTKPSRTREVIAEAGAPDDVQHDTDEDDDALDPLARLRGPT